MARRVGQTRRLQVRAGRRTSVGEKGALGPVRGEKWPVRGPRCRFLQGTIGILAPPRTGGRYGKPVSDGVDSRTVRHLYGYAREHHGGCAGPGAAVGDHAWGRSRGVVVARSPASALVLDGRRGRAGGLVGPLARDRGTTPYRDPRRRRRPAAGPRRRGRGDRRRARSAIEVAPRSTSSRSATPPRRCATSRTARSASSHAARAGDRLLPASATG